MVATDTTILLQMFTEWKQASDDWSYRTREETEDMVPTLKEPTLTALEDHENSGNHKGKRQIQSDMSSLPLLANPLHWSGLLARFEE